MMQRSAAPLLRSLRSNRNFSSSSTSDNIVASVLFERLPVVIPKIDPVVYAFQEFSLRWQQQYRRKYPDEVLAKADARGKGDYQIDYEPAPRITEADKQNDRRSYVFAVSVHRVQLLLQVLSVKRFHPQQQQQAQAGAQEELTSAEINEISDYFSRRVASEPYDASRVASFITLLTLPISILREFLKLFAWKKTLSQAHGGDITSAQRARIELCLENHSGSTSDEQSEGSSVSRSNIHYDRAHNSVDFALTFVLDHAHIPHINAAGGAAWLPYCISVRLKFSFGESTHISFIEMNGSHGGRACWSRVEDWEKCKQRLIRTVEYANGNSVGDVSQGRLKLVAENLQRTLQVSLQQLRDGSLSSSTTGT